MNTYLELKGAHCTLHIFFLSSTILEFKIMINEMKRLKCNKLREPPPLGEEKLKSNLFDLISNITKIGGYRSFSLLSTSLRTIGNYENCLKHFVLNLH